MTGREFLRAPGMKYALALFGVAVITTGWVAVRVNNMEGTEVKVATLPLAAVGLPSPVPVPSIDVADVVSQDLFAPNRTAPARRYLLPGESDSVVKTTVAAPREPPRPVVLGVTPHTDSTLSFVTVQVPGGRGPTIVRIGGKAGEYILVAVDRRSAFFQAPAGHRIQVYANR
jgi:hypothetical protein